MRGICELTADEKERLFDGILSFIAFELAEEDSFDAAIAAIDHVASSGDNTYFSLVGVVIDADFYQWLRGKLK